MARTYAPEKEFVECFNTLFVHETSFQRFTTRSPCVGSDRTWIEIHCPHFYESI